MKLFEALLTFTPDDESSGEGIVTVSAESEEEARAAILEMLEDTPDLEITSIRELVEIPEGVTFTPRTLN